MTQTPQVERKWRPPLAWIVHAVLLAVVALPAMVVVGLRLREGSLAQMGRVELIAIGIGVVATLVIGWVFSRTLTGPIQGLIRTTEAIRRGGRRGLVAQQQHGTRELAVLSQSFLDLAEQLVDRTDYVRGFAMHVSHELKSPLTSIRGSAELLLDGEMEETDRRRFLEHILADADRLALLLDRLRELARADLPPAPAGSRLDDVLGRLAERFPDLAIAAKGETGRTLALPPEALEGALTHLLDNALQHGARTISLELTAANGKGLLHVRDDGPGIPEAHAGRIFEPFFTTRREAGGTGMGLQIVRTMLQTHGGGIRLVPGPGGAVFELTIVLQETDWKSRPADAILGA